MEDTIKLSPYPFIEKVGKNIFISDENKLSVLAEDKFEIQRLFSYPQEIVEKNHSNNPLPFSNNIIFKIINDRLVVWFPYNSIWITQNRNSEDLSWAILNY
ncbi:MAG: hypothetical protein Q9M76_04425 [Candidatus Dojkabacteria bacterium]|nr:hypothetical protein [Candidatus Dojkabacteria bacterium]